MLEPINVGPQEARRLRKPCRPPPHGRRSWSWPTRSRASASSTSRRPRSAAVSRRSTTRCVPLMATPGCRPSGGSSAARRSSSRSRRRSTTRCRGTRESLDEEQRAIYADYNRRNAEALTDEFDFVIVHDPQPCAMIEHVGTPGDTGSGAATSICRRRTATSGIPRAVAPLRREPSSTVRSTCPTSTVCRPATSGRPRSTRSRRRTWRSRPRTPRTSSISSGSTSTGRCSRRFPASTPGRTRWGSSRPGGSCARTTRRAARAGRVDGARRSGRLGLLQPDRRAADGDPDIYILSNLNNVGSVEVNAFQVHSAAVHPEVDPRRVRPDGHRRRSGRPGRSWPAASAASSTRSRRARRGTSSTPSQECADALRRDPRRPARRRGGWRSRARSTCGAISSRRGSCATGWRSSTACSATTPATTSSRRRRRERRV